MTIEAIRHHQLLIILTALAPWSTAIAPHAVAFLALLAYLGVPMWLQSCCRLRQLLEAAQELLLFSIV